MSFEFVFFVILVFVGVRAAAKKVVVIYRTPTPSNMQVGVVQRSENFEDLGTEHIINPEWDAITIKITVYSHHITPLKEIIKRLDPKSSSDVVAFMAELKPEEKDAIERIDNYKWPKFDDKRWYRMHSGMPTLIAQTNFEYKMELAVYERVVCFVAVEKFGDKVNEDSTLGFATFLEFSGQFYPNEDGMLITRHREAEVVKSEGFDYNTYCQPKKLIAVKYGNTNIGTPDFENGWEYYRLKKQIKGQKQKGFEITRIWSPKQLR